MLHECNASKGVFVVHFFSSIALRLSQIHHFAFFGSRQVKFIELDTVLIVLLLVRSQVPIMVVGTFIEVPFKVDLGARSSIFRRGIRIVIELGTLLIVLLLFPFQQNA